MDNDTFKLNNTIAVLRELAKGKKIFLEGHPFPIAGGNMKFPAEVILSYVLASHPIMYECDYGGCSAREKGQLAVVARSQTVAGAIIDDYIEDEVDLYLEEVDDWLHPYIDKEKLFYALRAEKTINEIQIAEEDLLEWAKDVGMTLDAPEYEMFDLAESFVYLLNL